MLKRTNRAFFSIAARVETELGSPAVILVTSALDGDGTTMVGSRLADALVEAAYRVAVVDVRQEAERKAIQVGTVLYPEDAGTKSAPTYSSIAVRDLGESFAGSRRDVAALIARLRVRYDYVIVDAPSFSSGALPTLFAAGCDGVIVAVSRGRSATAADRDLNGFLDGGTKHTLGIVAVTREAIADFEADEAKHPVRRTVPIGENSDERSGRVPVVAGSA